MIHLPRKATGPHRGSASSDVLPASPGTQALQRESPDSPGQWLALHSFLSDPDIFAWGSDWGVHTVKTTTQNA